MSSITHEHLLAKGSIKNGDLPSKLFAILIDATGCNNVFELHLKTIEESPPKADKPFKKIIYTDVAEHLKLDIHANPDSHQFVIAARYNGFLLYLDEEAATVAINAIDTFRVEIANTLANTANTLLPWTSNPNEESTDSDLTANPVIT